MTLDDYFPDFLEALEGQSVRNRGNYRDRLGIWLQQHGHKTIHDVTRADVNAYLQRIRDKGYAKASRAGFQQALKKFLGDAARDAGIRSPADHVRVERRVSKEQKAPPESDVQRVVALAWRRLWLPLEGEHPTSAELRRVLDAAVYLLSVETGARLGELVRLRKSKVEAALRDPDENGVYVVLSHGKRGTVDLEFTDVAAAALRRWLELRPSCAVDRLFTTARRSRTGDDDQARYRALREGPMTDCFYRLCDLAGVPRHTSHPLRHRLGELITRQVSPKAAAIKLNHADATTTAATAIAFYHKPRADEASQVTVTMRPVVDTSAPFKAQLEAIGHAPVR